MGTIWPPKNMKIHPRPLETKKIWLKQKKTYLVFSGTVPLVQLFNWDRPIVQWLIKGWGVEEEKKSLLCILPPKPRGIQSVGAHLPPRHEHENIHQDFCESCKLSGNKVGVCADCDWVGLDCRPCSYKCDLSWCRRHRPSVSHLESIVQYSVICRTGLSWVIVICNWQNMILIRSSVTRTNFCFVHQVHYAHHSCRVATIAKKTVMFYWND